ncbi:DUF742 domain-containing protein [Saccharomonospora sp. NPDC046836]|uniref:DUF742 domain-containing protein n=1 Tax=Saccharomonospora sp. NPDC046836 TaxID=3156921 RepID=UPI0033D45BDB
MGSGVDAWEALHQGTGREGIDAPERFDLRRLPKPNRKQPVSAPARFEHRSLVRPYARTGGRTRPGQDLQLESLVSTSARGRHYLGAVTTVQRFICDLCVDVRSVAEIAAYARLPLGVVKVIVDDLAEAGALQIQQPGLLASDRDARDFMARILDGLRTL